MSRRAFPRVARVKYMRNSPTGPVLVTRITEGPQSEMGRQVNIPVKPEDLPALREVVARLEARQGLVPLPHGLPDPDKGEYISTETGEIKVCRACVPGSLATRHTCGLAGLQAMLPIGGSR